MKKRIISESGSPLGLSVEGLHNINNCGFRRFGLRLLFSVFAVHFVITFLGLYLVLFYAELPGYRGLAKLIVFVVPGVTLLLGVLELFFISVLCWEFKTSNHLEHVLVEMYDFPEGVEEKDLERLMSEKDPIEASFPVKQCMEFIEHSNDFGSVKFEYETIGLAFSGGKMTYKEYRQRVAEIALRLGYQGLENGIHNC